MHVSVEEDSLWCWRWGRLKSRPFVVNGIGSPIFLHLFIRFWSLHHLRDAKRVVMKYFIPHKTFIEWLSSRPSSAGACMSLVSRHPLLEGRVINKLVFTPAPAPVFLRDSIYTSLQIFRHPRKNQQPPPKNPSCETIKWSETHSSSNTLLISAFTAQQRQSVSVIYVFGCAQLFGHGVVLTPLPASPSVHRIAAVPRKNSLSFDWKHVPSSTLAGRRRISSHFCWEWTLSICQAWSHKGMLHWESASSSASSAMPKESWTFYAPSSPPLSLALQLSTTTAFRRK